MNKTHLEQRRARLWLLRLAAARQAAAAAAADERQSLGGRTGGNGEELEIGGGIGKGGAQGGGSGVGSGDGCAGTGKGGGSADVIGDQVNKNSARWEAVVEQMAVLVPMVQAIFRVF